MVCVKIRFSSQISFVLADLLSILNKFLIEKEYNHSFLIKSDPIMEMERVTEFPMSNVDLRPRKRQRIGWEAVHPATKVKNTVDFLHISLII